MQWFVPYFRQEFDFLPSLVSLAILALIVVAMDLLRRAWLARGTSTSKAEESLQRLVDITPADGAPSNSAGIKQRVDWDSARFLVRDATAPQAANPFLFFAVLVYVVALWLLVLGAFCVGIAGWVVGATEQGTQALILGVATWAGIYIPLRPLVREFTDVRYRFGNRRLQHSDEFRTVVRDLRIELQIRGLADETADRHYERAENSMGINPYRLASREWRSKYRTVAPHAREQIQRLLARLSLAGR
ncbi:hypothetical protein FOV72_01470 [Gordonia rubripertincta]|uniref:DUF4129 domain-containing protein n=1 Tax=Gordonia rubripertincta TaxID=36822 RepID=A0AAW4G561_GORRU|nr:hypothetical protein [Gordonia rubripertincta]MBM7278276.1 hypothetical protein [Gordonia rubripertincta]TSD98474.1 hypothetical protein FOV72_01470 [Gordonia rubripertincta]